MARPLKSRWGNRNIRDFIFQIGFDFVTQLRDIMGDEIGRAELAKKLGVSKGRVSQVLNNPGNLTMLNVVQYPRALGYKVAIVVYDDSDPHNENGPILPQIFAECWARNGRPHDFFDLRESQMAVPQNQATYFEVGIGVVKGPISWNPNDIQFARSGNVKVLNTIPGALIAATTTP